MFVTLALTTPVVIAGIIGLCIGALGVGIAAAGVAKRRVDRYHAAQRRAREAERMAEMGALATGLAHEIKNPLSTIGLNAQLLAEAVGDLQIDDADKASMQRRVRTLGAEAERLREILADFLDFAREIKLEPRPTDLNVVVEELADFYMPQAESQQVRLRVELAPSTLVAPIDPQLVKQAALNLLLNAVQAMGAQTTQRELILRTERRTGDEPAVALHVIDTGPGIPPETLADIFKPYYTTKPHGSGLGLPTARRIAEAHSGSLQVHTEPGRGTDFTLVFPAT
jgi:signal transduction histidine kinase